MLARGCEGPGALLQSAAMPAAAPPRRAALRIVVALGSLALALLLGELALRASGFRYELRATVITATAPNAAQVLEHYRTDADRLWVPRSYDATLAQAVAERPPLVFMGDSCTELGRYPESFAALVGERSGGGPLRYANLASAGWTTHQGLAQLELDVRRIRPRLATVYYGWNDHWLSIGLTDRGIAEIARNPLFRHQGLRLIQLANRAQLAWRSRGDGPPLRVPLPDFRDNLRRLVRGARALQVTPVLLTAPSSHERGAEPRYLAERWVADLDQLVPLHESYVAAVREVAAEQRAPLCDLARAFAAEPAWKRRTTYFQRDGIHLLAAGDQRVAAELYGCLEAQGLLALLRPG
jgi:lysophospholipase L1-like esterase